MRYLLTLLLLIPFLAHAIDVHFSPRGGSTDAIVAYLGEAQQEIVVATYVLTSLKISTALKAAKAKGVDVKVVADSSMDAAKCCARDVAKTVPLCYDAKHSIMHNKYVVIDRKHVLTGSFNFSGAAETSNAENIVFLRDVPDVAQKFLSDWSKHNAHCTTPIKGDSP